MPLAAIALRQRVITPRSSGCLGAKACGVRIAAAETAAFTIWSVPTASVAAPCCNGVANSRSRFWPPQCVKDFTVEQLMRQLSVEAFAKAILPRTAPLDVSGLGSDSGDPNSQRPGDKLRVVVGTNVNRDAPRGE
jgi:hypothetical protein